MHVKIKAVIIGFFVTAVSYWILGNFSYILGGTVTGYLLATDTDDYIDGTINGAISVTVFVLLIGLYNLFLFSTVGYNFYGISMFDSSLEIVI